MLLKYCSIELIVISGRKGKIKGIKIEIILAIIRYGSLCKRIGIVGWWEWRWWL